MMTNKTLRSVVCYAPESELSYPGSDMRTVLYKRQEFVELSFNPVAIVATHSKERGEPFGHADMAVFTPDGQNVWFTLPIHDRESLQQSYEELSRFEDVIRGLRKSLQNELSASND